jgi:hypothetical protein
VLHAQPRSRSLWGSCPDCRIVCQKQDRLSFRQGSDQWQDDRSRSRLQLRNMLSCPIPQIPQGGAALSPPLGGLIRQHGCRAVHCGRCSRSTPPPLSFPKIRSGGIRARFSSRCRRGSARHNILEHYRGSTSGSSRPWRVISADFIFRRTTAGSLCLVASVMNRSR